MILPDQRPPSSPIIQPLGFFAQALEHVRLRQVHSAARQPQLLGYVRRRRFLKNHPPEGGHRLRLEQRLDQLQQATQHMPVVFLIPQ
jgi:hypothetical protein